MKESTEVTTACYEYHSAMSHANGSSLLVYLLLATGDWLCPGAGGEGLVIWSSIHLLSCGKIGAS